MLFQEIRVCRKHRYLHGTVCSRSRKTGQGWGGRHAHLAARNLPAVRRVWSSLRREQGARLALPRRDGARVCGEPCWVGLLGPPASPQHHLLASITATFHHSPAFLNEIRKHRHDILHLLGDDPSPCAGGWTPVLGPRGAAVLELGGPGAGGCLLQGSDTAKFLLHVMCYRWCLHCGASIKHRL